MTRHIGLLSALVLELALLGVACAAEEGLVAHVTFDEHRGQLARDVTGNGHDGTVNGPAYVKSPRGYALAFDGVDDTVTYAGVESMNLSGDMTLVIWIKADASDAPESNRLIFGDSGAGVERNLNLRLSCYGQLMFEWADGTRNAYLTADAGLLNGTWKQVSVVCDSEVMAAGLYVDGEQLLDRLQALGRSVPEVDLEAHQAQVSSHRHPPVTGSENAESRPSHRMPPSCRVASGNDRNGSGE